MDDCARAYLIRSLVSLAVALPLVHGNGSSGLCPRRRHDDGREWTPAHISYDRRRSRSWVGARRPVWLARIVHLDLVRGCSSRKQRHRLAAIQHPRNCSVEIPDVDLAVVRAGVDVSLSGRRGRREVAANEGAKDSVARVSDQGAVLRMLHEARLPVERAPVVESSHAWSTYVSLAPKLWCRFHHVPTSSLSILLYASSEYIMRRSHSLHVWIAQSVSVSVARRHHPHQPAHERLT